MALKAYGVNSILIDGAEDAASVAAGGEAFLRHDRDPAATPCSFKASAAMSATFLFATGESDTVEFKKSTAELTKTGETLCAFLNAAGGQVLIGVTPSRGVVGQPTSEATTRDIQVMLNQLEPPAPIVIETSPLPGGATVIRLVVPAAPESVPFTFRRRPYRRLGTATSLMPQEEYQRLLLERLHARRRWENEPARAVGLDDLDRDEIVLTVRRGVEAGRLLATTGSDVILDRLGSGATARS